MENATNEVKTSGASISYWIDSVSPVKYTSLKKDIQTDVVIVGGGIAGLSVAYCALNAGLQVVLVEDGFIGSGETGRTTAHLSNALDDRYYELERMFGEDGAKLAAQSHTAAIDLIEKIVDKEGINCDFKRVPGYLFLHPSDKEKNLDREFEAAKKAGLKVKMLASTPNINDKKSRCIEYPNQAQFHIMKYMRGLAEAVIRNGGQIYTETHANKIDHEGIVTNDGKTVSAKHVVIATNTPVNDLFVIHTKQQPFRTYVIGATIPKGSMPHALWWDTGDMNDPASPYHYVRLQEYNEQYDLLIVGGEDHVTGKTEKDNIPEDKRYTALEVWTKLRFPIKEIIYHWSGQVMEPMDGMAFIGRNPMDKDNVYIVTGDSGNGMTHGTLAGILITDLIKGKENAWEKIYRPGRFKILSAAQPFIKENISVLAQYLKDYPGNGDVNKLAEIQKGEGRVIEINGEKWGAYRDDNDQFHIVSAVCTHLQCIVHWNNEEMSWDCPCHGSRFTIDGKVMNGPANTNLPYYQKQDEHKVVHKNAS